MCCVQAVVDCGALESLVTCLEEYDPSVKEGAAWVLGYIAGHSPELAQQVGHQNSLLLLCLFNDWDMLYLPGHLDSGSLANTYPKTVLRPAHLCTSTP